MAKPGGSDGAKHRKCGVFSFPLPEFRGRRCPRDGEMPKREREEGEREPRRENLLTVRGREGERVAFFRLLAISTSFRSSAIDAVILLALVLLL